MTPRATKMLPFRVSLWFSLSYLPGRGSGTGDHSGKNAEKSSDT